MKVVDLSVQLEANMPRFPSAYLPDVEVKPAATHAEHGRSCQILRFGTHVSTHIDAPFHAIPSGWTVDQVPPEYLIGVAHIIRFKDRDADSPLCAKDFEPFTHLKTVEKLVIDTTWAKRTWGTKDYFTEGPFLTRDGASFLAELPRLHMLGMDFPNIDQQERYGHGKA